MSTFARSLYMVRRLARLGSLVSRRLQQKSVAAPGNEEFEQDLALGREQRGVNGGLLGQQLHVAGDDALQQLFGIRAGNAHDAAVGKQR